MNHDDPASPSNPEPSTTSRHWKVASIPITALVIVAGVVIASVLVFIVAQNLGTTTEHSSQTFRHVPDRVTIEGDTAEIEVVGTAEGQVAVDREIEWARTKPDITETWHGQSLDVDIDCSGNILFGWLNDVCRVGYHAEVPTSAALELTTKTGGIIVSDIDNHVDATTTTGSISIRGVAGELVAAATTGSVSGIDLDAGEVTARTSTGDIDLAFSTAPRRVIAELSTGDVVITVPDDGSSYRVVGDTQTGERRIDVATNPTADRIIDVTSTTGDVTIEYSD